MSRSASEVELLLIDVSAICYACAYQPALARFEHQGKPTGVLLGAINSISSVVDGHPHAVPIILWDGHAWWRYALYPDYKAGRDDDPAKQQAKALVREQAPILRMLLTDLGVPQMRHPDLEADDLAGCITAALGDRHAIRMISPDTDWWQAIGESVDWRSTITDVVMDLPGLQRITNSKKAPPDGWRSPAEYLQAKIMSGDATDGIVGIPGIGMPTAAKILRTTRNGLSDLIHGDVPGGGKLAARLREAESKEILVRNTRLMDWAAGRALLRHLRGMDRELERTITAEDLAAWVHSPQVGMAEAGVLEHGLKALAKRLGKVFGRNDCCASPLWHQAVSAVDWISDIDADEVRAQELLV